MESHGRREPRWETFRADRRLAVDELTREVGISRGTVHAIHALDDFGNETYAGT